MRQSGRLRDVIGSTQEDHVEAFAAKVCGFTRVHCGEIKATGRINIGDRHVVSMARSVIEHIDIANGIEELNSAFHSIPSFTWPDNCPLAPITRS